MSLYTLKNLTVDIDGERLVNGVDIDVEVGKSTAIIGASGSGKSLTCLTPFGLNAGTASGTMVVDLIDLSQASGEEMRRARSQLTGFVFQQPLTALVPHLTVGQQLREAAAQGGISSTRDELVARLKRVGLTNADEQLDQYPHCLSGGECQRVMIAAAIAHGPRLLIADEPTSALDASLRNEIMELLDELCTEHELAMLLVSHDLASVVGHADHLVVMENGRVVESGPTGELSSNPQEEYTRRLIAATPRLNEPAPQLPSVGEIILETHKACVNFPRPGWRRGKMKAITDVDIDVHEGEALAIVGGSGSGKSTLGRAIAGIGPLSSGSILWKGQKLPGRRKRTLAMRSLIQPVFQEAIASLDPQWKVSAIIAEPLRSFQPKLEEAERFSIVEQALEEVGLDSGFMDRPSRSLSGGEAQRVAIARAIVADPRMLVLDEATSSLDPLVGSEILQLLAKLQNDKQLSILFITHDIAAARRLCHRIVVMDKGYVVETGSMLDVLENPTADVTKKLIASS